MAVPLSNTNPSSTITVPSGYSGGLYTYSVVEDTTTVAQGYKFDKIDVNSSSQIPVTP
ncbi:hypothetical protein AGMMS49992_02360 [Clostridia bacterium]|nr:hypothetical protein AGMMS49992_02360 [Clostridia bacterium]